MQYDKARAGGGARTRVRETSGNEKPPPGGGSGVYSGHVLQNAVDMKHILVFDTL